MQLWRISNHADLTGLGGELLGGRWHTASPGKRIVYLSEHPALALIENLSNLRGNPRFYPATYQLLSISVSTQYPVETIRSADLDNTDIGDPEQTQAMGDRWLAGRASALFRVPSAPSPQSWNYLLNPLHPEAASFQIDWAKHVIYDRRLFHVTK
jgi:RES domain-containing protein